MVDVDLARKVWPKGLGLPVFEEETNMVLYIGTFCSVEEFWRKKG